MELSLKDRVLILNFILPDFDSREKMGMKMAIAKKVIISDTDFKRIVTKDLGSGRVNIGFTDVEAISEKKEFSISDSELLYLKQLVDFQDKNGMFSEFNFETFTKIVDAPFESQEYQQAWDKYLSPSILHSDFVPSLISPVELEQDTPIDPDVITMRYIDRIDL